jgi:LPXTG-motif cell wall-anchored protein
MTSNAPSAGIRFVTSAGNISFQFGPNQNIPAGARVEITMAAGRIQVSSSSVLLSATSGTDTQTNNVPFTDPPVVTFNANFGTSPETMTQTGAKFSSAPLNGTFTRPGYTLDGWSTNADGTGTSYTSNQNYTFVSATTLYAKWTSLTRTVTFNANGGSGSMAEQSSFTAVELDTSTITRLGHGFTGWNTAADGTGTAYAVDATFPFTANTTLYAQWRALPATPIAEVEIQVQVGSSIADAPVLLDIDGLKDRTGYTVTVYSTPQVIDRGTIWSGRLNTTVRIPDNLEAGWHRLAIVGTAADGTPWTEETFFEVSPSGILLETSSEIPSELASTGSDNLLLAFAAMFLLLLGSAILLARK